jgi:hypothetical protein
MALRLAIDLNLVDIALANNGPITVEEFARKSKADANLVRTSCRPPFHSILADSSK